MKAIMISIRPEFVEKILNGKKTIEIRKTEPNCKFPIKVYIYCTKGKTNLLYNKIQKIWEISNDYELSEYRYNGKVVAEFTLNVIEIINEHEAYNAICLKEHCCLTPEELQNYTKGKKFYAWHIDDLKIYNEPKELSEFYIETIYDDCCIGCPYHETPIGEEPCKNCYGNREYITRPPQSWCYVEELEEV